MDEGRRPTARERARAELTRDITDTARRQLAEVGASSLSLRAVARELGMASSAIYRYFSSRDELLTALIVDAYDAVGSVAEEAAEASRRRSPRNRWVDVALAIRGWALEHPHEYALVYGSPVPGYEAPALTVTSGRRASLALVGVVRDAHASGPLRPAIDVDVPAAVQADFARLRGEIGLDVDDDVLLLTLTAWTQLFGLVSFELFGQTRNGVDDHDAFFTTTATAMATAIGL